MRNKENLCKCDMIKSCYLSLVVIWKKIETDIKILKF